MKVHKRSPGDWVRPQWAKGFLHKPMNLSTTNAEATASNKYNYAGGHKNILDTHIYPIRVIIKLKDLLKILAWKGEKQYMCDSSFHTWKHRSNAHEIRRMCLFFGLQHRWNLEYLERLIQFLKDSNIK